MLKNPFKKTRNVEEKILDPDPDPGATDPFSTLVNLGRAVRGHGRIKIGGVNERKKIEKERKGKERRRRKEASSEAFGPSSKILNPPLVQ